MYGIRVADPDQARHSRQCFNQLEKELGRETCALGLIGRHFDVPFIWEMATRPSLLDAIESLIGRNVLLWDTYFFCKYGPQETYVAWHQDVTYWGLEPPFALTAWYAIDDCDASNGCMRVIPGSQHGGILEHGKSQDDGNLLSKNQQVVLSREEEEKAIDIVLEPGEVSLHDGKLLHSSQPNRSTRRRCGLTIRYIPTRVKPAGSEKKVVLVRGEDKENHFQEFKRPEPMPHLQS